MYSRTRTEQRGGDGGGHGDLFLSLKLLRGISSEAAADEKMDGDEGHEVEHLIQRANGAPSLDYGMLLAPDSI